MTSPEASSQARRAASAARATRSRTSTPDDRGGSSTFTAAGTPGAPSGRGGVGMGTASVVLWAATFAITFVFPVMNDNLGLAYSAWIFAAMLLPMP